MSFNDIDEDDHDDDVISFGESNDMTPISRFSIGGSELLNKCFGFIEGIF